MSSLDPLEIEVDMSEPAIESTAVVENGPSRGRGWVAALAVVLLGFIGWQLLASPDSDAEPPVEATEEPTEEEAVDEGAVDEEVTEPPAIVDIDELPTLPEIEQGPEYSAAVDAPPVDGGENVGGVAEASAPDGSVNGGPSRPAFPLFPDRRGLTLAFASGNGEILLLNADDGAQTLLAASDQPGDSSLQQGAWIGRSGDTLVVRTGVRVFGYPLDGGPRIDFGDGDGVSLTRDSVILMRYGTASSKLSFRSFPPDGRGDFEWVEAPSPLVGMDPVLGLVSAPDGTYSFLGDGFQRVSAHQVVAVGANHRIEVRCDAALQCEHHRVDVRSGQAMALAAFPDSQSLGSQEISPDGNWVTQFEWLDGGRAATSLVHLSSGEKYVLSDSFFDFRLEGGPVLPSWDESNRYAALATGRGQALTIFDAETREIREVGRDDLNVNLRLAHLEMLAPGEI